MTRMIGPTDDSVNWRRQLGRSGHVWSPGIPAGIMEGCAENAATDLPKEITATLKASGDAALRDLLLLIAIPDWERAHDGGTVAPCPDVLAVASNESGLVVIATEARVDEPFGITLGELRADANVDQAERVTFLHDLLKLRTPLPDILPFQLLHRAGSTILTARAFHADTAVMLVHSFSTRSIGWEDFSLFCRVLGAKAIQECASAVPGLSAPRLFFGWCAGDQRYMHRDLRLVS